MTVSFNDVVQALPARECFMLDYVEYAHKQGKEAALVFHVGVGLSILSATVPIDYGTRYAGHWLRANLYTLLVGPSGDGKSASINRGVECLRDAAPDRLGKMPGSPEGLFDDVQARPQQLITISEWGDLLAPAKRGYFEGVKTKLTDLYDGYPTSRAKAKNKDNKEYRDTIEKPRLSLLAGCSVPYLERHTLIEDWTGGFMGRFLIMYGELDPAMLDPWPIPDMSGQPKLVKALKERVEYNSKVGICLGPEPGRAADEWDRWYREINARVLSAKVAGVKRRAPVMALKAAMLYHWDYGTIGPDDWYIDYSTLKDGIALAELHLRSIIDLSESISINDDARMLREVANSIEDCGGQATLPQILSRVQRRQRLVQELIETLKQQGAIRICHDMYGDEVYTLVR